MKKIILLFVVFFTSSLIFAQSLGIQAGVNSASETVSTDGSGGLSVSTQSKWGFLIGVTGDFPINRSFSFRPELNYIQKGSKVADEGTQLTIALNYLELPLNFVYTAPAGKGSAFIGAGPSIGYGLSGKISLKEGGQEESHSIKFDGKSSDEAEADEYGHLKALDLGFNIFAGYKFSNNVFANLGYGFGLSDIDPESGSSLKNRGFFIKIGYLFSKGKK